MTCGKNNPIVMNDYFTGKERQKLKSKYKIVGVS